MPPKANPETRRARKSTAGKPASSRSSKPVSTTRGSARVTEVSDEENTAPSKRRRGADNEDSQDELGSDSDDVAQELTAGSAKKRKSDAAPAVARASASPAKKTAGRQSLKGPASPGKATSKGRPSSSSNKKTTSATAGARKSATKSSSKSKKSDDATTRRKRTSTTASSDDDDDDTPTTRSRSARGYTWAAEVVTIAPEIIMENLSYHSSIKTDIDADSDDEEDKVRFKRDELIYVLPDPHTLPPRSEEIGPQQLPDDEFWCARILDCCALDQGPDAAPLGLLRIAWYYTPDQLQQLPDALLPDYKRRLQQYRFGDYEMIASDHIDFVGVDTYCGYPDGRIHAQLMMHGLEVDDVERMKPVAKRLKSKKQKRMTGFPIKGTGKDGVSPELSLQKLSKESPEDRRKRIAREERRLAKKRRESQRDTQDSDEEATDEE